MKNNKRKFCPPHKYNVPVVHYWRPFTPLNSKNEQFRNILNHVSKYANCSVVNGLRLNDGIRNHISKLWPELNNYDFDFSSLGEVWPKGVRQRLHEIIKNEFCEYPVFFGNTPCSVSKSLHQPDRAGVFAGRMCKESNCNQRELCKTHYRIPSIEEVVKACSHVGIFQEQITLKSDLIKISGKINTQSLVFLRNKLRFPVISESVEYIGGHNWANVTDNIKITEIEWDTNNTQTLPITR